MASLNNPAVGPIIAGTCISCMGMVRISQATAVNATVRCPHCKESFLLTELLDQSLPALEVVPNLAANQAAGSAGESPYIDTLHLKREEQSAKPEAPRIKFEIPKALRDGAKRRRRRRRKRRNADGSSSGSSSANGASGTAMPSSNNPDAAAGERPSTEARERGQRSGSSQRPSVGSESSSSSSQTGRGDRGTRSRRRSERSRRPVELSPESSAFRGKVKSRLGGVNPQQKSFEMGDVVKTAMGAMIAIPFAYLLLIWVFKADPLWIAKPISRVLPFAVPASMHADGDRPEIANPDFSSAQSTDLDKPFGVDDGDSFEEEPVEIKRRDLKPLSDKEDRIAIPTINPDWEAFGQEFGL